MHSIETTTPLPHATTVLQTDTPPPEIPLILISVPLRKISPIRLAVTGLQTTSFLVQMPILRCPHPPFQAKHHRRRNSGRLPSNRSPALRRATKNFLVSTTNLGVRMVLRHLLLVAALPLLQAFQAQGTPVTTAGLAEGVHAPTVAMLTMLQMRGDLTGTTDKRSDRRQVGRNPGIT